MIEQLDEAIADPDVRAPIKTFLLEAHGPEALDRFVAATRWIPIGETEELVRLKIDKEQHPAWLDTSGGRFWRLTSVAKRSALDKGINEAIGGERILDRFWLPVRILGSIGHAHGEVGRRTSFERRLRDTRESQLDERASFDYRGRRLTAFVRRFAHEMVRSDFPEFVRISRIRIELGGGRASVSEDGLIAGGPNFAHHADLAFDVLEPYKALLTEIEQGMVLAFDHREDGWFRLDGSTLAIEFPRAVENLEEFCGHLFNCREPFRLWGLPRLRRGVAEIEAVDLHVGRRMRFDITPFWMRVYLLEGGCGNSILRLVTNLQAHFEPSIRWWSPATPRFNRLSGIHDKRERGQLEGEVTVDHKRDP